MDSQPTNTRYNTSVAERPLLRTTDIAEKTAFEREFQPDYQPEGSDFDEFTSGESNQKNRQRGSNRIGKKYRDPFKTYTEEDVYDFLAYLDKLWRRLAERVKETLDEFDNWNKWFKKEKKKPPSIDKAKVVYIREEFNAKRSPHLWKSNPNRKWVLSFGNNAINNIVSAILYKYQNETISKDA